MDQRMIEQGCAATERVVEAIRPEQLGFSTPCSDWDVRALLGHVVGVLALHAAVLRDEEPDEPMVDLGDDDPLKAYRSGVEELLAAAGGDALERIHRTPMGEMPGHAAVAFVMMDVIVHGWDLARATGQTMAVPEDVAADVLGFVRQAIPDEQRAPHIGPAVAVAPSAPALDQLVAFLGRTP